ncbi:uncharacterized protein LOC126565896 [Anopheles maculipalpis]|uniref:uncharacterized protein LOC126565896 n=1 Tax=Anopheles maculipalpis TaxID=1496333 RepID=UPI002158BE1D|nr:uncharacterized protein LOC126565896 [Anopheles maculipalpis]
MTKRNAWSKVETLELLDILRMCCIPFLDGTINNRKGQMYRQIEHEMQRRGNTNLRDARQIEHKWKNLKFAYDRYREELVQRENNNGKAWVTEPKPCEFYTELEELFCIVEQRAPLIIESQPAEEMIVATYYDEEFVTDETQELAVDDDTVVIEEIVYDSQDAIEFEEAAAAVAATATASTSKTQQAPAAATAAQTTAPPPPPPASSQPAPKRKKLTVANMDELLFRICNLQQDHNESFNRSQMEFIENEFESFREKEREHLLQLKLDLEVLKQKFLARIQKVASGEGMGEAGDETMANDTKRRRVGGVVRRK